MVRGLTAEEAAALHETRKLMALAGVARGLYELRDVLMDFWDAWGPDPCAEPDADREPDSDGEPGADDEPDLVG